MYTGNQFVSATANFEEFERIKGDDGEWRVKATNVSGVLQENGDFIFFIDTDAYRKLVQTTNVGQYINSGDFFIYFLASTKWEDSSTWSKDTLYRITDFTPITGIVFMPLKSCITNHDHHSYIIRFYFHRYLAMYVCISLFGFKKLQ